MKQIAELLKHYKHFLTKFKKTDKKRGSPKLIKANQKTANVLVLSGIIKIMRGHWTFSSYFQLLIRKLQQSSIFVALIP